jgi:hypothetical protein
VGAKKKTVFKYCYWDRRRRQSSNIAFGGIEGEDSLQILLLVGLKVKTVSTNIAFGGIDGEGSIQLLLLMGLAAKTVS